jgi:transcriptional regulator with XRE-family HTH domain
MSQLDVEIIAVNRLAEERLAAGFAVPADLAARAGIDPSLYEVMEAGRLLPTKPELDRLCDALGGVPADRLYRVDMLQQMGAAAGYDFGTARNVIEVNRGPQRLFVAKEEVTWLERREVPDHKVDVLLSMSCGTLASPHLLLDTVADASALGLNFVATAGPAGCCGKPYLGLGQPEAGEAFSQGKIRYARAIGADTTVVWCTADQQTALNLAAHRRYRSGVEHPVREMQILGFLEERVRELGDRVPWKREVRRRVLAEGHREYSNVHTLALEAQAKLLSLIPGVEMVGTYDGSVDDVSPCAGRSRPKSRGPWKPDTTPEEVQQRRVKLAEVLASRGADTIACQHQGCHQLWGRYASERVAVRHAVSILAEALGCAHPDRAQAAAQLGDADAVVEQTRPVWQTWGMSEDEARTLARMHVQSGIFTAEAGCACGGEHMHDEVIPIDVLSGRSPGLFRRS